MDTLQLKNKIIQRIVQIEDEHLLKSLEILLNTSDENIHKFLTLANEKLQGKNGHETEDFTDYIKEWVKSM